jgi:hypothetical protein
VPLLRRALAWIEGDSSYAGRVRQALADAERARASREPIDRGNDFRGNG